MTRTVSSKGREVAELIAQRAPFKTYGAMYALDGGMHAGASGQLDGEDLRRWQSDARHVTYAVFSYSTPIAWYSEVNGWYKVKQKFSVTTSKHQGKLYLIPA